MPEILLPTASKQDSIKNIVESIASNFPLEINHGTDWSSYKPFAVNDEVKLSISSTDYINVFNMNGEGYLAGAISYVWPNNSNIAILRVTVDGVVIFNSRTVADRLYSGVLSVDKISDGKFMGTHTLAKEFEVAGIPNSKYLTGISNSSTGSIIFPNVIFFKSSLKVELMKTSGTYSDQIRYVVHGGIKK